MTPSNNDSHTTSPLQQAIEMNNRAAGFMVTGENNQGLLCFQATVRAMKEASITCTSDDSFHKQANLSPDFAIPMMKPCSKALLQQIQKHAYVYDHPFLFEPSQRSEVDSETLLALYSGTMLFNFGLALHTDGLMNGRDSYLRKALYIYEMALYLLQPNARCGPFTAVITVILNNEADVYCQLGENANAERQFSHLADMLHSMYWPLREILSGPVVDELYLNTLVCTSPCASHAA